MSKILEATCTAGIVKVGALAVPGAFILSEGVGSSSGVALIEGDKVFYAAKTSPDLKTTLERAISALQDAASALTSVTTALTAIGANMTGPTTSPPPTLAADVAVIVSKALTITASATALEALKGALK